MIFKRTLLLKKTTLLTLVATVVAVSAFVVYAQYVDHTKYKSEKLVIIPDNVTSDSWSGLNSVLVQDISEYSLYQDFSTDNSAYISELGLYSHQLAPVDGAVVPEAAPSGSTTSDTTAAPDTPTDSSAPTDTPTSPLPPATEPAAPPAPPATEPVPAPATPPDAGPTSLLPAVQAVQFSVLPRALPFPLAQAIIDEVVTSSPVTTSDNEPVPVVTEPPAATSEPTAAAVTNEVLDNPVSTSSDTVSIDGGETSAATTTIAGSDDSVLTNADSTLSTCDSAAQCSTHSMLFTGFTLPEFESGTILDSVQLRMSLAAQLKRSHGDGPQRYVVEYTYDVGSITKKWDTAAVIDITDEISNSINGGYFLVSLDTPKVTGEIANLQVRISYQGNVAELERAYVEGVWLEVTSGTFYEAEDAQPYTDELDYNRDLLQPELNTIDNGSMDPMLGELPTFTLSYSPQQNFFSRILQSIMSVNTFAVNKITLTDSDGTTLDVPISVVYHEDHTWTLHVDQMPQSLKPGKYTVHVTMVENGAHYEDSFEFYWGVLAVNTKKSMYFPNEDVELNLAALTADGTTICDADLHLKIIDPKNTIYEVPVSPSESCGPNNVTDVPDYTAHFADTGEWGKYTIQLENWNKEGKVVHKIQDSFEVRNYIPYDIVRSAPTRIYPPAPYTVNLDITAHRDFDGDITERVPRGFVIGDIPEAVISTLPQYTLITWKKVLMKEGDRLHLSYTFDAPDISPYMYLLGPLDMDSFTELRQWQIASDALNNIGWFTGNRTVASTSLNSTPSPLQWATSSVDNYYFTHSTSTQSERVTLRQDGDYLISVNLPQYRTDAVNNRSRGGIEVRVNGVAVPQGLGRSGYIFNTGGENESSSHVSTLLVGMHANDYVEVYEENLNTINVGENLLVFGQASMYLEYMSPTETVFAATTTQTTVGTNLNTAAATSLSWIETRQDSGYLHSDTVTPENITISASGTYMVHVNIPISGITNTVQNNIKGQVLLNGVLVTGGLFQQGYLEATTTQSDGDASIHWSGIIVATTTNQILSIAVQQEAGAGTTTVTPGFVGSIFVQKVPTTNVIALTGRALLSGTNWNPAASTTVKFDNRLAYDSSVFTHSTTTNNDMITIGQSGDYLLSFNNAVTGATANTNSRITVQVSSTSVSGAVSESYYVRAQNAHSDSSGSLVFLLSGLTAGQHVTLVTVQEGALATVNTQADAIVMLWKKVALDFRPAAPSMFNTPFDNARSASTTPYFDFQANDPDGASKIQYQFSISTTSDFATSTLRVSGTDTGFRNTASSTEVSPYTEANMIRFQLQAADTLTDLTTYYWRVRANDVTGSGQFGDWSTTQSFTVNVADTIPNWYQTQSGQFQNDTLVGSVSNGSNNNIKVNSSVSSEILVAYGDSTTAIPKYRLWGGTSWGAEQSALSVGGTVNWVRTAAGINRDEYTLVTMDQSNASYAQIYSASTSAWGSKVLVSSVVADVTRRGIAVGYESLSGDAMVVSCNNNANPVYRKWNGSSWSATTSITAMTSTGNCNYLELASDPISNEMILVMRDASTQYEAVIWNGTTWGNQHTLGSPQAGQLSRSGIGLAYESSGDQAIAATTLGTTNGFRYATWDGTTWSANSTQALTNDFEFGRLTSNPNSDIMTLCYTDDTSDIGAVRWDGAVWGTFSNLAAATGNGQTARPVDCEYETVAGRSGNALAVYSDTTNGRYNVYATSSWSAQSTISGLGSGAGMAWVQTERAGNGTIVALAHDDAVAGDEIESTYWNGTSWSTKQSIVPNPSSVANPPYETFEMAAKRFQYTTGTVRATPISFTHVPNQATWGDVSFSTTEPVGTDVLLRVRYTASTTCDTYVPNGTLPGNTAGFDVSATPIILTSLSTSTYSQICLEATLTSQGGSSASLDDWSVSWLRKPKLSQSLYRWYTNGSYLTPTDPWPLGLSDVAENTALTSSESVSLNGVIRLRLQLTSANVALPTTTSAFKLQYGAGLSCSAITSWSDVGDAASSTAIWRGYGNSIVGSDWYNASWNKRLALTITKSLVAGTVTNFPVYVNLADLPVAFFSNVRSDGGDIRVTRSDGITEVPIELVAISTGGKTGELHFKGDLSAASTTTFYLYYSNATGTAYAANATYGSQNVWTNSYSGVYHLNQDPTNGSPQILDSTSNARHASRTGAASSGRLVSAKIGNGLDFFGTGADYTIDFPTFALGSTSSYTYSAWFKTTTTTNGTATDINGTYIADRVSSTTELTGLKVVAGKFAHQYRYTDSSGLGALSASTSIATTSWQYVVWGRSYNNSRFIYADAVLSTTTDTAGGLTPPLLRLGGHQLNTNYTGLADELRISNATRTATWVTTEYNNQTNATGFYGASSEEQINDGRQLPSVVLTGSDYPETYEEYNPTRTNIRAIPVADSSEWDFALQNNLGVSNTNYCFRMVYSDGSTLNTYSYYPRLITNAPPLAPVLSAPFDNKKVASTSPYFEFAATDEVGDQVSYEISVDDDYAFGSPVFTNNSNSNFSLFSNLSSPAERSVYSSGQTIRFIPSTALTSGTTYWWRVRAKDDNGSGAYGSWSSPQSFTVDSAVTLTTWFQTTGDQFNTNSLTDGVVSTSSNDIGIVSSFTAATSTTNIIDYDSRDVGNAWGTISFTEATSSGTVKHYVEYIVSGSTWATVPDADLPGNSSGFTTSPISIASLDTTTYNQIRITSVLSGNSTLPRINDMTVTWSQKIDPPNLVTLFDNAKSATTTPAVTFYTTDPQSDDLQYEVQISTAYNFTSSSTYLSGSTTGFTNMTTATDTSPFISGQTVQYQTQSALTNGVTYWWRVRARDPLGGNSWSNYSTPFSFTIDTSIAAAVWYQTVGEQFQTDATVNIATTSGGAQVTTVVNGVMVAYGEGTGQAPQYRTWNGSSWSSAASANPVNAQIRWTRLKAAPTRSEYALATIGTDDDITVQVYDGLSQTWGDSLKLNDAIADRTKRAVDISYETLSGKLMGVACVGTNAVYSLWNGTSWSATSTITLANGNTCEWVQMASDPISNEVIAVFRHQIAGTFDYEALVWNGTSWGNSKRFGELNADTSEGMAIGYEESGNQAVLVTADNLNTNIMWASWNGSTWSATSTAAISARMFWGSLKNDVGSDRTVLCYIDVNNDIGVMHWSGSGWGASTIMTISGNSSAGQAVDCDFLTSKGTDGDVVIPYSDTTAARYQTYNYASGTYSGEFSLDTINNSYRVQTARGGDGTIHAIYFDDASAPRRYDTSRFDGTTWTTKQSLSTNPAISVAPFDGSVAIAAQIYPNVTEGSIMSTPITFSDGSSPRWERVRWNDTTPGLSDVLYHVYYQTSGGSYSLIPDADLAGNAIGFTNSPVDISGLDRTVYTKLKLQAELLCDSGNCPSVQDWSVEWSQGITVSGSYFNYDQTTVVASGTIAVAVNGVVQTGKTAEIATGTTTQQLVYSAVGTSTFTVPTGITSVTVKAWGAAGGAGAGGDSDAGGSGAGGGFVQANLTVTPAENLTVLVGGGGSGGATGLPPGGGGGGGYSALMRTSTPLVVAGAGGGGGAGAGGVSYVSVGTACAVTAAVCTPTIPAGTAVNDVYILVLNSRTNTAHACSANCTGWTEFSTQTGSVGEGRLSVWYYRQTGAVPVDPSFNGPATETYTGRIWAFRGVVTSGTPADVVGTNTAIAVASTTFPGSNLSSTVPDAMVVHVGGSMDDNTWGPASGSCTQPGTADVNFSTQNANGTDNSIFLCYKNRPFSSAGSLGIPYNLQATLGADAGRYITFALRPQSTSITPAGKGGNGGGLVGGTGATASTSVGGGAGTQSAGGAIGGGNATIGAAYTGGSGSTGTGGGVGGAGGTFGGGTGGTGASSTLAAGGGAGGAGYYGGGGGAGVSNQYVSGAGGGGGSSYIVSSALATTTMIGTTTVAANATDTDYSVGVGTGGTSATSTAGAAGGNGRVVISWTTVAAAGAWSIPNVTAFTGDVITVFVQNATATDRAVAVTKYDGVGNVSGMQLSKRHLTLGSNDSPTLTNANLALYTNSNTSDVFFSSGAGNSINLCAQSTCTDARLRILSGTTYQPTADTTVINFQNSGTFLPATSTFRVSSVWNQENTFTPGLSTIIFTATTSSFTPLNASSTFDFYNLTFGETSGAATWNVTKPLNVLGNLTIDRGTLARSTSTIAVYQNLSINASGTMTGLATTTFAGTVSGIWTDATAAGTNIGYAVIDGTSKTLTLGSNTTAQTVTIGSDDTLNASGSGYSLSVLSAWTNNNAFIPQSGTVTFTGTTTGTIAAGASAFNNLTFSGVGGNWSFATSTLALNGNLTIATGTVNLPTGTTTIAGSFLNTGGTFVHNNGEVRMTSSAAGKTITQRASAFLNGFYDLVFTGAGSWSYSDSVATTTRNMRIVSGTVTAPSSALTVGGDFLVSASGAFTHNGGELIALVQSTTTIQLNGSSLNNYRARGVAGFTRTFVDTNATILGNYVSETGGTTVFPTGVLSIGGSFTNATFFTANSGTVRFNATAGAKTINSGSSTFATVDFNSATGDFTVTQNATATVAFNLTNVAQFTLSGGKIFESTGTFTNTASGTNTTWTGSTLKLTGPDGALNVKTHTGDVYGTLETGGDTDVTMWNSSATSYLTGSTSSMYSQDHAGVDGTLNIYGNYVRTTGTEYWSYATDFDGAALTASTSRQANIRAATSSVIGFVNASLNMVGGAAASTTVDAQSGAFSLNASNTTLTAQNFRVTGTDINGFGLFASSTLSTFSDGYFTVVEGRTGISIASTTVAKNPSAQFFRMGFATSSVGSTSNVTMVGTTTAFVWFRSGIGGLYGELYDANDSNPGSIRFDDSSNVVTISGVVYADDGVTIMGTSTCNGTTPNVRVVVNGGTYSASTTCASGTGAYTLSNVTYTGDPRVIVYLDTNGGAVGSVVTKTLTGNVANLNIYANRVITRHEDVLPLTISDMTSYTNTNDTDIKFRVSTTSTTTLITLPSTELYVFASTTFAPGGDITLTGNASSSSYEGTLQLGTGATFTATGTETHTLAGRLVLATTSVFTTASSTFIFNATTTGKSITSVNPITFNTLTFAGTAGGWNITAPLLVRSNMNISSGTVTGTNNLTMQNGSITGNGILSFGTGTTTLQSTNTLGGTTVWTFANLVLGTGTTTGTTTVVATATTTVSGRLTIATAHYVAAGSSKWDLSGTGTVFTENGTLVEGASLFRYSGAGSTVTATGYYDLDINSGAGSQTYVAAATGLNVQNNLLIGGSATSTFDTNTNDPTYTVGGSVIIRGNGVLGASDVATMSVAGNWTNTGTFTANNGTLAFTSAASSTIAAGNSSFATAIVNGIGSFVVSNNATATAAFTLTNHASFTLSPNAVLAIGGTFTNGLGGAATTWASSTLSFYTAGTKNLNASTTNDVYGTLSVAAGTNIKMWNSSAATYAATGGIYSQNHAGSNGALNIYGAFTVTSGADYWSYATNFDGTVLSGGALRAVTVSFASSSSVRYSGGSLQVIGTTTATTTLQNQGVGTYAVTIGTGASTEWNYATIRDINASGVVLTGTATVVDFSNTDHLVKIAGGTGITVGGTVIDVNQAKNFSGNIFATTSPATTGFNVTATGTSVSSWRFTNHTGSLSGEAYDSDPAGDPGYLVWADSVALITVSGNVYSDEGLTPSAVTVCNGITASIVLRVAGLTSYPTTCAMGTGAFSIPNVSFSANDTLTLYIDNNAKKAVNVSIEPMSSISNMDLYENRVIVRHEGVNPMTIAKMAVWDSASDGDILFTTSLGAPNTLTLAADQKLLVWTGKTFAPAGNVTLSGGGAGGAQDGTLEAQTSATFRAAGTETHTIGGSFIFGAGATFTAAQSTTTFTTTGVARVINPNGASFYNVAFTGAGSWSATTSPFTTGRSYTQSNGTVTFGTATTTIGASFNVTSGTFVMPGAALVFTSTTTGNIARFNNSIIPAVKFTGVAGTWTLTDTDATTSGAFTITGGTVTLPAGNLGVARNFENLGGTLIHNGGTVVMNATSSAALIASSSSLYAVRFAAVGPFTMTDANITLLDSLTVASGTVTFATGTLSIGGNLTASGTINHASGTVLFNAGTTGKVVALGNNALYNVVFGSASGGWTLSGNATTTNNFSITGASSFTKDPNTTLSIGGVFTNTVGGAATTWATSTVRLYGMGNYTINTKTTGADVYGTLDLAAGVAIRSWNSSAATTTLAITASWYSQNHSAVSGALNIYGNFTIATTSEYWSYATDFDGAALGSSSRAVAVRMAQNATTTLTSGSLSLVGVVGATTSIARQATGTYAFTVQGGTYNAQYYSFANLNASGVLFSGTPTISDLSNGYYDLAVASGTLITVPVATLDANASKIFTNVGFNATGPLSGYNVQLVGSTSNAWRFSGSYGTIGTESYDIDGVTACGSIRFDSSGCLLTQQTNVRWRNDDGGEGVPTTEWYNTGFTYRKQIRITNPDATAYASSAVKVAVTYDASMQSNFADLRFTAADGMTQIPYWIERYTASTDAVVWVRVPTIAASTLTPVFMYFGSSTVSTTGSGTATFSALDDFEDNNITEYSGDTALFQTDSSPVYGGSYALEAANKGTLTTDGIFRTAMTVSQGQIIRFMQYIDTTAGPTDDACTLFGVQSPGANNNNYALCLEQYGTKRMVIAKNVSNDSASAITLASTTLTFVTGWYEAEIDWQTNNTIAAYLRNSAGTLVASTTVVDSSYTTGGIGFTFWLQYGSWDDYTARPKAMINPTVYTGAKQTFGGASWAAAQNAAASGVLGTVRRLRVAVENSGLDVTGQVYRLEYASKGVAPSCEAVSTNNFAAVPNQASCGSAPVCMQSSGNFTDGDNTTDLLATTSGAFTAGRLVENPSNSAASMNLNQNYYTELEYAVTPTVNASTSYCFRVTNASTALDYYSKVAELSPRFDPAFGVVTLNNGLPITLTPGATTTVYATGTVTDYNGYADIVAGTSTIYRSGVGPSCTANNNNCYKSNTASGTCSITNCSGNTCELRCQADIYFFADPTDASTTYEGQDWEAYLEVNDVAGGYDFENAIGQELYTLRALDVSSAINYGSLAVAADTGASNASTTVSNLGNILFNLAINGTDLTGAGGASTIPASQQKFSTTTFTYSACVSCSVVSSTTPVTLQFGLAKPTSPTPPVTAPVYWGIAIPYGTRSTSHSGTNVFTPVS